MCLSKKWRKLFFYFTFAVIILFICLISMALYVTDGLDLYIKKNILYIKNSNFIPIKVYSINKTLINSRLVNGETCEYALSDSEMRRKIKIILEFCKLKFPASIEDHIK